MEKGLIDSISRVALSDQDELLISDFDFSGHRENELLFFFKPECFVSNNPESIISLLKFVSERFDDYEVDVSGVLLLSGQRLGELGIMDRHYGLINKLSRGASSVATPDQLAKLKEDLRIDSLSSYKVLGGHEFLRDFGAFDEESLDQLWASKPSVKLRSGFYAQKYRVSEEDVLLVNGFHPLQLSHFTNPQHKIVVLLVRSDSDWAILKNDLVGNTFPEKASSGSLRREFFDRPERYGLEKVSIAANCVHLSAGPFEALSEIDNFLRHLRSVTFLLPATNLYRRMKNIGLDRQDIEASITNPEATIDGKNIDLFTFTEDKNSSESIQDYEQHFLSVTSIP